VIVWLNGPFGVGKTSVAASLRALLPGALIFDPEILGSILWRLVPAFRSREYQDNALWRWLTHEGVRLWARSGRVVIVPMTITNARCFAAIVERLRERTALRHYTLMASREDILRRVAGRAHPGWAIERIDLSLATLTGARFQEHIDTSGRSAAQVAAIIRDRIASSGTPGS
jgi:chloramphenicol 3-O-phosphotransferase